MGQLATEAPEPGTRQVLDQYAQVPMLAPIDVARPSGVLDHEEWRICLQAHYLLMRPLLKVRRTMVSYHVPPHLPSVEPRHVIQYPIWRERIHAQIAIAGLVSRWTVTRPRRTRIPLVILQGESCYFAATQYVATRPHPFRLRLATSGLETGIAQEQSRNDHGLMGGLWPIPANVTEL
jgi:hypothetical protein